MSSTTTVALETSIPPALSPSLQEKPETLDDSGVKAFEEVPPWEVTSNIRQDSPSPKPPSLDDHATSILRRVRKPIADDAVFGLLPPDRAPRFAFNSYDYSLEETVPAFTPDGTPDIASQIETSIYSPSSLPPRIYFAGSAITFVPPFSYDFLERDPSVKGVPRNYRAWARTGRPKMDLEGAERAEAKSDFLTMGLVFPHDSDSEDGGNDGDGEKKKKRKKKQTAKALMVPAERPRRMVRKIVEAESPTPPPLQRKRVNEPKIKEVKQVKPRTSPPVQKVDLAKKKVSSQTTEQSDSSGRRSSSTLLDTDVAESSKRKHVDSDKEVKDIREVPSSKKQRLSKRLYAKKLSSQDRRSSEPVLQKDPDLIQSPLSDLTPSPEPSTIPRRRRTVILLQRHSSPSPGPSDSAPPKTSGNLSPPSKASSSRVPPLIASRPGHRLSRDLLPPQPQTLPMRTFPASLPVLPGYSAFYRRYPVIAQFEKDDPVGKHIIQGDSQTKRTLGNWNQPRDHRDLYTPRYVKGSGNKKIALCPLCYEDPARGGEGRQEWNHTKTSQHNYHMQYYHGISATTCAPFSPPIAQRIIPILRPQTNEKSEILQGKCHVCKLWIALEGCKLGELKVKELLWWKHAAHCHKDSKLAEETDIFIEDDVFRRLNEYEAAHPK